MAEQKETEEPEEDEEPCYVINSLYAWSRSQEGWKDAWEEISGNLRITKDYCPVEFTFARVRGQVGISQGGDVRELDEPRLDEGQVSEVISFGVVPEVEWTEIPSPHGNNFEDRVEDLVERITWLRKDGEPQWGTEVGGWSMPEEPE